MESECLKECKWCGAEVAFNEKAKTSELRKITFNCGTYFYEEDNSWYRSISGICKDRQITALQTQLSEYRRELKVAREIINICRTLFPENMEELKKLLAQKPTWADFLDKLRPALAEYDKATKEG